MQKDNEQLLDDRKVKILDAIIRNYLATGEPVGSRTIPANVFSKLFGINVTISLQTIINLRFFRTVQVRHFLLNVFGHFVIV